MSLHQLSRQPLANDPLFASRDALNTLILFPSPIELFDHPFLRAKYNPLVFPVFAGQTPYHFTNYILFLVNFT